VHSVTFLSFVDTCRTFFVQVRVFFRRTFRARFACLPIAFLIDFLFYPPTLQSFFLPEILIFLLRSFSLVKFDRHLISFRIVSLHSPRSFLLADAAPFQSCCLVPYGTVD